MIFPPGRKPASPLAKSTAGAQVFFKKKSLFFF
jgi:hypothetical protein